MPALKYIILCTAFIMSSQIFAITRVSATVEPNVSEKGEPVRYTISIETDDADYIPSPIVPDSNNWDVISVMSNISRGIRSGKTTVSNTKSEFSYILKPLKKGTLTIPSAEVTVAGQKFKTDPLSVTVIKLPDGRSSRPKIHQRPQREQNPRPDPLFDPFNQRNRNNNPNQPSEDLISDSTIFVRGVPTKTRAYQGELIGLDYKLYRAFRSFSSPQFKKFPKFKDFIKEDIRNFNRLSTSQERFNNKDYYTSELIRYAIFPIKTGELKVSPLFFEVTVNPSPSSFLNDFFKGNVFGNRRFMNPETKELQSNIVTIESMPLPEPPNREIFTGAIGDFKIEASIQNKNISVDQPFTLKVTIAGLGNLKIIEKPKLKLPDSVEIFKSQSNYKFNNDFTGYKTFEYLLLAKKSGPTQIPVINFSYFDPQEKQYKLISTSAIPISPTGESAPVGVDPTKITKTELSPQRVGQQKWLSTSEADSSPLWLKTFWFIQAAGFLFLMFSFFRRRQQADSKEFFANAPWEKTKKEIHAMGSKAPLEVSPHIDRWIRQRLCHHIKNKNKHCNIHQESSRDEFLKELRAISAPQKHKYLQELEGYWQKLDSFRFGGQETQKASSSKLLKVAEKIVDSILR